MNKTAFRRGAPGLVAAVTGQQVIDVADRGLDATCRIGNFS
jgi:hypothetical protein